jgi:hypothetical protein
MFAHLKTSAAQLEENPHRLTCGLLANRHLRNVIVAEVNLTTPSQADRSAIDWDRFKEDAGYNGFIEARAATEQHIDLGPLVHQLFVSDAALSFDHMTAFSKRPGTPGSPAMGPTRGVAVFHYAEADKSGGDPRPGFPLRLLWSIVGIDDSMEEEICSFALARHCYMPG